MRRIPLIPLYSVLQAGADEQKGSFSACPHHARQAKYGMRAFALSLVALISAGCTSAWTGAGGPPTTSPTPQTSVRAPFQSGSFRVVEAATGNTISFATLI